MASLDSKKKSTESEAVVDWNSHVCFIVLPNQAGEVKVRWTFIA